MKLTIKDTDSCPIGARPARRVLRVAELFARSSGALGSYGIDESPVMIDADSSIFAAVTYVPANQVLTLIVRYRADGQETPIFAGIAEWRVVPVYFAFRLPTGRYIEFQFEGDTTVVPD